MTLTPGQLTPSPKITPEQARAILWHNGVLHWLLHDGQKDLYESVGKCKEKIIVWNCSRRLGKSFTLCVLAIETCLKTPNVIIKYCCAKQVDAKNIIRPLIRDIIRTCPKDLRPIYKVYEKAYIFPNGSRIELSGLDGGRAESIRGGSCTLAIIDEAGLVTDLKYIVRSIILPTTTTTKGKIVLASTPPKSSDHEFCHFLNKARIDGNLITKTVYDNPLIDKDELQKIIDECQGVNSIDFRREYLTEILIDENKAVVPEFTAQLKAKVVRTWSKPPFYDCYVAMDLGLKDLTVALFAYFDFKADKVIIEDEFVVNGQKLTTEYLANGIRNKEAKCFTDGFTGEQRAPYLRISDNNLIVIQDLQRLHGLLFIPTRKDDSDAALNNMRMLLSAEKIIINPRCITLINHLETATWNKARSSYDRSSDQGHFDAIDSLKYLIRNVQFGKNPFPAHYGVPSVSDRFERQISPQHPQQNAFNKMFNIKKPVK